MSQGRSRRRRDCPRGRQPDAEGPAPRAGRGHEVRPRPALLSRQRRGAARLIRDSFAKAGIAAEPEVAPTLRDHLGNDREITRREIEKLELFAASTKLLTVEDVLTLCADNATLVIDEIVDALGTGHAAEMETALGRALAAAVNPQQILSTVTQHFAQLRRWRAEVDSGKSPREVLDGARGRVHFSRKASMEQQLRLWTDDALAAASERLYQALAEARKTYDLQETVLRRALLAVCMQASGALTAPRRFR